MANNDDKQQIDDNVQEAEIVDNKNSQPSTNRALWTAIIVLLALSLASSGWFYQQLNKQQQSQLGLHSSLESELATLKSDTAQSQQQLGSLSQQQQALSDKLDEFIARETLTSADLMKTWALQEIGYLLNVANQRALLAHDINGARQALSMADQQIQTLSDYRLHPLRALIAEEMMALDAVADIDTAGIALKLQTAAKHVPSLRVKKGPEVKTGNESVSATAATDDEASWKQALGDIWQQLRSLVVIRHDQTGEAAVLVPEQRYFLYQNLRLQLESARLALLNADNSSYRHSLQTAIDWLEQYFTGDERDAMLSTLRDLQGQQINIAIPDISGSLNWLEEYQR